MKNLRVAGELKPIFTYAALIDAETQVGVATVQCNSHPGPMKDGRLIELPDANECIVHRNEYGHVTVHFCEWAIDITHLAIAACLISEELCVEYGFVVTPEQAKDARRNLK